MHIAHGEIASGIIKGIYHDSFSSLTKIVFFLFMPLKNSITQVVFYVVRFT